MISIIIPTYNMPNTKFYLRRCLDSIASQSYKDFEVVMPDNSHHFTRTTIQKGIKDYDFPINYFVNPEEGMAVNTNKGIAKAKGDLIKILFMDDMFAHDDALKKIVKAFKGDWLVTGCSHTGDIGERYNDHLPKYNDKILTGNNTIGSPSVLTIKKGLGVWFDEDYKWVLDCVLYEELHRKYGKPTILKDINVVIGIHGGQVTSQLSEEEKKEEIIKVTELHDSRST